jgi:hypothetical protein
MRRPFVLVVLFGAGLEATMPATASAQVPTAPQPSIEQITSAPLYDPVAAVVAEFRVGPGPTIGAPSPGAVPLGAPQETPEERVSYGSSASESLLSKAKDLLIYDPLLEVAAETLGKGFGIALSTGLKAINGELGGVLDLPGGEIAGWLGASARVAGYISNAFNWAGPASLLFQSVELGPETYPPRTTTISATPAVLPDALMSEPLSAGADPWSSSMSVSIGDGSWSQGAAPYGGLPYSSDGTFQYYVSPAQLPPPPDVAPPPTPAPTPTDPCDDPSSECYCPKHPDDPDCYCVLNPTDPDCWDDLTQMALGRVRRFWHSKSYDAHRTPLDVAACAQPEADCFCAVRPLFCCDLDRTDCRSLARQRVFREWRPHAAKPHR